MKVPPNAPSWQSDGIDTVLQLAVPHSTRISASGALLITDEMRRPVSGRDAVRSQVIDVL